MDFNYITQDERERLYNEVWTDPVMVVAQRYDMSDNGLRKHLKRLWIPLPPSGYWAKVKAGQKVSKPDLPDVRGELKKYVYSYIVKYRKDTDQLADDVLIASEGLSLLTDDTISFIRETCSQIKVKKQLRNPHKLIVEHKEESIYRKKRDKSLQQNSYNTNYYYNTKDTYRDNKATLPINVSDVNLNRVYRILDALINAIEGMEGYTKVSLESGKDKAYFAVMNSAIYFEIKEENKNNQHYSIKEETPPFLLLSLHAENWHYRFIQYSLEYKDEEYKPLEDQIGRIILDIFQTANKIQIADILAQRESNRVIEENQKQQHLEQMRKGKLEEMRFLEQAALDWDKAQRIRDFANNVEVKIKDVTDEVKRERLLEWLKWARGKADWLDPLTEKEDVLLGKRKHLFDAISGME